MGRNSDRGWQVLVLQQTPELLSCQEQFQKLLLLAALLGVFGVSALI